MTRPYLPLPTVQEQPRKYKPRADQYCYEYFNLRKLPAILYTRLNSLLKTDIDGTVYIMTIPIIISPEKPVGMSSLNVSA